MWTVKYVPQTNAMFPYSYYAYWFLDSYVAKFSCEEAIANISQKEGRHSLSLWSEEKVSMTYQLLRFIRAFWI